MSEANKTFVLVNKLEFDLKRLSASNWKVKNLLRDCGGFSKLPPRLQILVKELLKRDYERN